MRDRQSPRDDAPAPPQGSARADGGRPEPSPARVVADADVLACDLLVDGDARRALDHVRSHSWVTLVASDHLLDEAEAVIRDRTAASDPDLAADWRTKVESLRQPVEHPAGDHPALASAYAGGAMHLLSFDESLGSAGAGMALRKHVPVSVRPPDAFAALFDPESLYPEVGDGEYPGPDRDPRD
jgi:predicted nucleic acid-binding protein